MGEGRGSSTNIILMLLCMFMFHSKMMMTHADEYIVGDGHWTFGVQNWPLGKTFKAGDTLVFNYIPLIHNVVVVDESHYNSCVALGGSGFYYSGADRITLAKGPNYFICGILGHCNLGMKIVVNAS